MNRQPIAIAWDMPVVTFSGVVSAQAQPGEQVIITVKKPNGTSDTATAVTNASGAYLAPYSAATGTGYSAVATVAADAKYQAAKSPTVTFSVPVTSLEDTGSFLVVPDHFVAGTLAAERRRRERSALKVV